MSDGLRLIAAALEVSAASTLAGIPEELFQENETTVRDFVLQHFRRYRESPQVSTVQEETGVRLPSAPESLSFYVDRVYERHEYNEIRERFGLLREGLASRNMSQVAEIVSDMSRVSRQRNRRGLESLDIAQAAEHMMDRLLRTSGSGGITGVESGWPSYDQVTGGYQRGDLVSVVGRPSLGKTYVLLKQAWHARTAGSRVLFVTTEMAAEQIARRHASVALGIDPTVLRQNMLSTTMLRRLQTFYTGLVGAEGFQIFSVGMKAQVGAVEAFMQEFDPDIVFVDGAYLMRPTVAQKNQNRIERITSVFDELKVLTLDADKPVVVSTQFSRQAGKQGKDGSLENIGYTDAIGTHSSAVVAIRPGPTADPMKSRWLEFLKGREGESGKIAINFKFAPLDMSELVDPGEETQESGAVVASTCNLDWME